MTNSDNILKQIAYIKNLIEKTLNLPVTVINSDHEDLLSNTIFNHDLLQQMDLNEPISLPQIELHSLGESFILISYIKDNECNLYCRAN